MKRYRVLGIDPLPTIQLHLINRQNNKDCFKFNISIDDLVSILYIDNIFEIGEKKEYAVHGRIIDINYVDIRKSDRNKSIIKKGIFIKVDAGERGDSKILVLDAENILDIHKYPYEYNLTEYPKLIPENIRDGFFINEKSYSQKIDVTVPDDVLLKDTNFNDNGGKLNE